MASRTDRARADDTEQLPRSATAQWGPPPTAPVGLVPGTNEPVEPERRSRAARVLATVLVIVVLAAGALVGYLWRTTSAWHRTADQWEALAQTHGQQVADARDQLAATQSQLQEVQTQLETAQARITQLADEKAQLGDSSAASGQLADYQARVSQAAGRVATALANCIDGQKQLIGYLQNAAAYDATQLAAFQAQVDDVCTEATDANTQLQLELDR